MAKAHMADLQTEGHVVPAGQEKLRVHRRFFKDLQEADMNVAA